MEIALHLTLFGGFLLLVDDAPVTTLDSPRLQGLLAYLALHRQTPLPRSQVAFLLWPEASEAQAHTNLRALLRRLRAALPELDRFLQVDRQRLAWRDQVPWSCDVAVFEAALAQVAVAERGGERDAVRAALRRAAEVYRGDLLPSLYDDWLLAERERLRDACLQALAKLALFAQQAGDLPGAIAATQQLLRIDPLHEPAYRTLIELYNRQGDRAGALRAYHSCATTLERELGATPGPLTQQVYTAVLRAGDEVTGAVSTPTPATPLVARAAEWRWLQSCWPAAARRPRLALLHGEPGVGKTRLAEELLHWAAHQGIATAAARCYASEGAPAYGPVAAWLRAPPLRAALAGLDTVWLQELARLLPELGAEYVRLAAPGPLHEPWQRQRLFEALARAARACGRLLLLLDDLQWCDHETLAWLRYLLRAEAPAPLLVVATARDDEPGVEHGAGQLLADLRRSGQLDELALAPLDHSGTAALAAALRSAPLTAEQAARLHNETEGNPLFVVEAVRAGLWMDEVAGDESPSLPTVVQSAIAARLAQLSPGARPLAELASIVGRAFSSAVLREASGLDEDSLVQGLDELWARRVIREYGADSYDFSHDKLREVLVAQLPPARRRQLHRRIGSALAAFAPAEAGAAAQIAHHYALGGEPALAVTWLERAAVAARSIYAHHEAVAHLRRALELAAPSDVAAGLRLRELLGASLLTLGHCEAARAVYHEALEPLPPGDLLVRARLLRHVGATYLHQDDTAAAARALSDALELLGEPPDAATAPEQHRRWMETWIDVADRLQSAYYFRKQHAELAALIALARPRIERYGTPEQQIGFLESLGSAAFARDRFAPSAETLALARSALAAAERTGDAQAVASHSFGVGLLCLCAGQLDDAVTLLNRGLTGAERLRWQRLRTQALSYLAFAARRRGQVEEAHALATQALAAAEASEATQYVGLSRANLGWAAWRRGRHEEAARQLEAALAGWRPDTSPFLWAALLPQLALVATRPDEPPPSYWVEQLLHPLQQRLPDQLTEALAAVLHAVSQGDATAARAQLNQALAVAQEVGYL